MNYYIVAKDDRMIQSDLQRAFALKLNAKSNAEKISARTDAFSGKKGGGPHSGCRC
ncbi:hypothetical protein SHI21_18145 [Bacteriovorax sp. PP10]|uniref:Uncharacterized protein n=1 Tax=Bacteriovorax antarcticus TaxID=3088717 RepID=A0ABU5VYN6_9BACT|nr:hypothetical protein [Bacteriovorax sp. PP10]MEA9358161.1 hypothetical protein [Bacteriovorax sp. PP10]